MSLTRHRHQGFTLLEVVIAMGIIALVVAQLSAAVEQSHFTLGRLEQKTLAHTLAMNRINEVQVLDDAPKLGTVDETQDLAQQKWQVKTAVTASSWPNIFQIEVSVSLLAPPNQPLMLDKVRALKGQRPYWDPLTGGKGDDKSSNHFERADGGGTDGG